VPSVYELPAQCVQWLAYIIYCQLQGRNTVASMAVARSKRYAAVGLRLAASVRYINDNSAKSHGIQGVCMCP
jgi:hypothetical protein